MLTCQYLPRWLDKRFICLRTTHRVFTMPTNRLETQNIWRGSKTTHGRKHPPLLYTSNCSLNWLEFLCTGSLRIPNSNIQIYKRTYPGSTPVILSSNVSTFLWGINVSPSMYAPYCQKSNFVKSRKNFVV
jgi:hypothetical protein